MTETGDMVGKKYDKSMPENNVLCFLGEAALGEVPYFLNRFRPTRAIGPLHLAQKAQLDPLFFHAAKPTIPWRRR